MNLLSGLKNKGEQIQCSDGGGNGRMWVSGGQPQEEYERDLGRSRDQVSKESQVSGDHF
jgi:hypothetical protein